MPTKQARNPLQAYTRSKPVLVKAAFGSGKGDDTPFEVSFSSLAHAYLRDRAPSLLDHELGFQLLDRNDENTKAIGVFGFKVGSQYLYAPVFFLQGELKGTELLYIKTQDLFVPLEEGWLNYLLHRKPNIIGEGVTRSVGQIGVQSPDLSALRRPPTKYASWIQDAMPAICFTAKPTFEQAAQSVSENLARFGELMDLRAFTKQASLPALEYLIKACQQYPDIAAAVDRWHGLEKLSEDIKAAGQRSRTQSVLDKTAAAKTTGSVLDWQHPIKTGELKIITRDYTDKPDLPDPVTEEDKEKLLRDGVLIKDKRDPHSTTMEVPTQKEQRLFNPTETGLYQVLVKPGTFEKCFIAFKPFGPHGRKDFCTVVRVGDKPNWMNTYPAAVWCAEQTVGEDYTKWWDGLKEATSLKVTDKTKYVLVGQRGHTSVPFSVEKEVGDGDSGTAYEVDFRDYCSERMDRPALRGKRRYECYDCEPESYSKYSDGQRVRLDSKQGTAMRSSGGDLWVPTGCKLLQVEQSKADKADKDDKENQAYVCVPGDEAQSENAPIRPGDLANFQLSIVTARVKTGAFDLGTLEDLKRTEMSKTAAFKLFHDGVECQINNGRRLAPRDALISLVRDHGMTEKLARDMLKRAAGNQWRVLKTRVKYAEPYLTNQGPTSPAIPDMPYGQDNMLGYPGAVVGPQDWSERVPGLRGSDTDRTVYDPKQSPPTPMDLQQVQNAAQSGQKEVFDTAMIGQMLKAVRDDSMIDKYIPKLMAGMDAIGRVLFSFYWHGEKFADRYGKADMPELEDSLRNSFIGLGELVLFIKHKAVEPYPEEDAVDMDLSESAGSA